MLNHLIITDMEDAHTHILSLPGDQNTCFFGVFDGHGGQSRLSVFTLFVVFCACFHAITVMLKISGYCCDDSGFLLTLIDI